jgi:hypothetical protein
MKSALLKKAFTLFSSLSLVTLFLLYRIGAFEEPSSINQTSLQISHNGGNINPSNIDTTIPKKDSTEPLIFPSSKVIILTDRKPSFLDSLRRKPFTYKYPKSETEILGSSKSGIVFKPQPIFRLNLDSFRINYDSLKLKMKTSQ